MSYQALPNSLHIKDSQVAGQGIFAKEDIPADTFLGLSHIILEEPEDPVFSVAYVKDEIFRTPLGGFINHSDEPNCTKYCQGDRYYIKTLRDIKSGEELFLKYTFYSVHK